MGEAECDGRPGRGQADAELVGGVAAFGGFVVGAGGVVLDEEGVVEDVDREAGAVGGDMEVLRDVGGMVGEGMEERGGLRDLLGGEALDDRHLAQGDGGAHGEAVGSGDDLPAVLEEGMSGSRRGEEGGEREEQPCDGGWHGEEGAGGWAGRVHDHPKVNRRRPARRMIRKGAPKAVERLLERSVSRSGPEAMTRPARRRRAWVKQGTISST